MKGRILGILLTLLAAAFPAAAQLQLPDSAQPRKTGFLQRMGDSLGSHLRQPVSPKPLSWKAIAIPAGLITYGSLSVTTGWFDDVNLFGRRWATANEDPDRKTSIDDYTEFVPAAAVFALDAAGVKGRNNVVDRSALYVAAYGIAHLFTIPLKRLSRQTRPDSSDLLSFPSGHTSTAFVSAEFLRQEYKGVSPWIGAGGYAVAILTGYLRMYNNKHWFSDVMAGAGIGILSTRLSYWLYPKLKNAILGKSGKGDAMVLPFYQQGGMGLSFVYGFR